MRAVEIARGRLGFELRPVQRERPRPREDEVLIEVAAAGVNGHDVHQLHRGHHEIAAGESDLPGLEVAGTIVEIGANVHRWNEGDRVCALLRGGGYAEYASAPASQCLPAPAGLSWVEAASLPEALFTVWSNVFVDAGLCAGETFLMNGATSGIGVAAVQLISALGHDVYATARGPEKCKVSERLGARRAFDYERENFAERIIAETGGKGVDVILDIVGGDYLEKDLEALATRGRLIFIGAARGYRTEIDLQKVIRKQLRICGSLLRPRSREFKARVAADLESRVWPLIDSRQFRPVIDRVFDLEDAASALDHLEQRKHVGKVMLEVARCT